MTSPQGEQPSDDLRENNPGAELRRAGERDGGQKEWTNERISELNREIFLALQRQYGRPAADRAPISSETSDEPQADLGAPLDAEVAGLDDLGPDDEHRGVW